MKITNEIQRLFGALIKRVRRYDACGYVGGWCEPHLPFADVIFQNITELVTDLANDVTLTQRGGDKNVFVALSRFYSSFGQIVFNLLYEHGVVVIGHSQIGEGATAAHTFSILRENDDYSVSGDGRERVFTPLHDDIEIYVMQSPTYAVTGHSDKRQCRPWLTYIDNVMDSSNTISARLGSLIFMSPKAGGNSAIAASLDDEERKQYEEEWSKGYGSLSTQKQIFLTKQEMNVQAVNMAGLDQRTLDKVKMAVCVIADRLKVPSNQISIIDAASSKSLANGTELREGDFNKYQTFERLFAATFWVFAEKIGCPIDYVIYNKPERQKATI